MDIADRPPKASGDQNESAEVTEDAIDYFESSLEFLFDQHQPATGQPGQLCSLRLQAADRADDLTVQYRIPASQTNKLFAHYQWDSGLFLSRLIYHHSTATAASTWPASLGALHRCREANVAGLSVLELGAGTGLPSLVAARCGAQEAVITDYPDEGILAALRENVRLAEVQDAAKVRGLDWADSKAIDELGQAHAGGFQRILCADVLWLSSSHQPLLHVIHSTLDPSPSANARCIVVSGFHTGRRALASFFRLATSTVKRGADGVNRVLAVSKTSDGEPQVYEYNVVRNTARPWSGLMAFPDMDEDENIPDNMDDFSERTKWLLYVCMEWTQDV